MLGMPCLVGSKTKEIQPLKLNWYTPDFGVLNTPDDLINPFPNLKDSPLNAKDKWWLQYLFLARCKMHLNC